MKRFNILAVILMISLSVENTFGQNQLSYSKYEVFGTGFSHLEPV